jgi:hypothetical protein
MQEGTATGRPHQVSLVKRNSVHNVPPILLPFSPIKRTVGPFYDELRIHFLRT